MNSRAIPSTSVLILAILLPAPIVGCGLEPALLGAGISAAQSGVTMVGRRKLRSFEMVSVADMVAAVELAATDLGLHLLNDNRRDDRIWMYYRYNRSSKIEVTITPQTSTVTQILVDVGSASRRGMGALFLNQVYHELATMDAYLEDWNRDDPRRGGFGSNNPD